MNLLYREMVFQYAIIYYIEKRFFQYAIIYYIGEQFFRFAIIYYIEKRVLQDTNILCGDYTVKLEVL